MDWGLKSERISVDGREVLVRELSGSEAAELWPVLAAGESSGSMIEAFKAVIAVACTIDGAPVFAGPEEAARAPIRVLGRLAGKVLELSDLGVSQGNLPGALGEDSPIT